LKNENVPFGVRFFLVVGLTINMRKSFVSLMFSLLLLQNVYAGDSLFCRADTLNEKRFRLAVGTTTLIGVGSLTALASVWYQKDNTKFHTFNDLPQWKQMDKVGHVATTYNTSLILTDLYRWSGVGRNESKLIGSTMSMFYMTVVEVMDGVFIRLWIFLE
jgi:hypothetical protein